MADSSFWNIGNIEYPVIQGQAGKPFYHQQGPLIQFGQQLVDNSCLCKYRYARYFAYYCAVPSDSSSIAFFKNFEQVPWEGGHNIKFLDYTQETAKGYQWGMFKGPVYLGCYPTGHFTTGKWLPVELPYENVSQDLNVTSPSPYYIYQENEDYNYSLKCMIVSSYQCCNGEEGCGVEVQRGQYFESSFPFCYAQFFVSNLDASDASQVTAALIEGSQGCVCTPPYRMLKKFQQYDCSTATIRVFKQMVLLPEELDRCSQFCPSCQQELPALAPNAAFLAKKDCVYWVLWKFPLPQDCSDCSKTLHKIQWQLVTDYKDIPGEVVGKGPGWKPLSFHDPDETFTYCEQEAPGKVIFQWQYVRNPQPSQGEIQGSRPAVKPDENPCKEYCRKNPLARPSISDSLSGASDSTLQKHFPCNEPQPPPMKYREFLHTEFDVYELSLRVTVITRDQVKECYQSYKIDTPLQDWHWNLIQNAVYDYQLTSYLYGTSFRGTEVKNGFIHKYVVQLHGEEPPEDPSGEYQGDDFDIVADGSSYNFVDKSQNLCQYAYQVYLAEKCKCFGDCISDSRSCSTSNQSEYISGWGCSKWQSLGQHSQYQIRKEMRFCLDKWSRNPEESVHKQWVYTTLSDDPYFCEQYPQPLKRGIIYDNYVFTPNCSDSTSIVVSFPFVSYPWCGKQPKAYQGYKAQDSLSSSTLLQVVDNVIDLTNTDPPICTVYGFIDPHKVAVWPGFISERPVRPAPCCGEEAFYSDSCHAKGKIYQPPIIKWPKSCLQLPAYGVRVYIAAFGHAWPGFISTQKTVDSQTKYYVNASKFLQYFNCTKQSQLQFYQELPSQYPEGWDPPFSGFYQTDYLPAKGNWCMPPIGFFNQLSPVNFNQGSIAQWAGGSGKVLLYIFSGHASRCQSQLEVGIRALAGKNIGGRKAIGVQIPLNKKGAGDNGTIAYSYDCVDVNQFIDPNSEYYHKGVLQRAYENQDITGFVANGFVDGIDAQLCNRIGGSFPGGACSNVEKFLNEQELRQLFGSAAAGNWNSHFFTYADLNYPKSPFGKACADSYIGVSGRTGGKNASSHDVALLMRMQKLPKAASRTAWYIQNCYVTFYDQDDGSEILPGWPYRVYDQAVDFGYSFCVEGSPSQITYLINTTESFTPSDQDVFAALINGSRTTFHIQIPPYLAGEGLSPTDLTRSTFQLVSVRDSRKWLSISASTWDGRCYLDAYGGLQVTTADNGSTTWNCETQTCYWGQQTTGDCVIPTLDILPHGDCDTETGTVGRSGFGRYRSLLKNASDSGYALVNTSSMRFCDLPQGVFAAFLIRALDNWYDFPSSYARVCDQNYYRASKDCIVIPVPANLEEGDQYTLSITHDLSDSTTYEQEGDTSYRKCHVQIQQKFIFHLPTQWY